MGVRARPGVPAKAYRPQHGFPRSSHGWRIDSLLSLYDYIPEKGRTEQSKAEDVLILGISTTVYGSFE